MHFGPLGGWNNKDLENSEHRSTIYLRCSVPSSRAPARPSHPGLPQNARTKGSVVYDCVVVHNDVTIAALDWKFFAAILKKSRADQLKSHMPAEWGSVPVFGPVFRR